MSSRDEAGTSPITALFSVAIFLGFLLVAVQVLAHLYTTSVVNAAAFEAARLEAGSEPAGRATAEAHATALLGGYGQRVSFDWSGSGRDEIVLRISGPSPAALIRAVGQLAGLDTIDRQVRVRVERFVEAEP